MSDEGAAAVPLSGGGGLERRVGRVAIRYLYLDGLAYSDLETSDRKAYGKERRPSVRRSVRVCDPGRRRRRRRLCPRVGVGGVR